MIERDQQDSIETQADSCSFALGALCLWASATEHAALASCRTQLAAAARAGGLLEDSLLRLFLRFTRRQRFLYRGHGRSSPCPCHHSSYTGAQEQQLLLLLRDWSAWEGPCRAERIQAINITDFLSLQQHVCRLVLPVLPVEIDPKSCRSTSQCQTNGVDQRVELYHQVG